MTKQELTECIDLYGRDIYSFCRHLAGNVQEADELYQDTWLLAAQRLECIDASGNVKSYCLSAAVKIWNNRKRKFAWRRRIAGTQDFLDEEGREYLPDDRPAPEELLLRKERDRLVWQAVDGLPDKFRTVTLLHYMEELNVSQIAQVLHISQGTVKSRLYHARQLLKKKLEVVLNEE